MATLQLLSNPIQKTNLVRLLLVSLLSSALLMIFLATPAHAATPPDSCFNFNSGTGTITDYYDNEGNNGANPACTRDVDIPATIGGTAVTVIGVSAFENNNLTSVTIPDSVTVIGEAAFAINNLTSVTIPDSVTTLGDSVFRYNNLTSVTLGNSVTTIGELAFSENQLTSVTIPDSVTTIDSEAFAYNNLTSVTLGSSVTTIGEAAFAFNQLSIVQIPNSVTTIGQYAFAFNSPTYSIYDSQLAGGSSVTIEDYMNSIVYVRLYTDDPSNPSNFQDEIILESEAGGDFNSDGDQNDRLGGHLINPAQATISYQNSSGSNLQPSQTFTGTGLTSYLASENTTNDPALYYRLGSSQLFTAPTISGYPTPANHTLNLTNPNNPYTFVYTNSTSGTTDATDTSGTSTSQGSGGLAETGENISLVYTLAVTLITLAGAQFLLRSKIANNR